MSGGRRVEHGRATAEWLALREPADAVARSLTLLVELTGQLSSRRERGPVADPMVVHDLGSGTGSMRRWLAPRLPWPQQWVQHDRDVRLAAVGQDGGLAEQGRPITCDCELADLTADHLAGAELITCSALLDVLTTTAADRLVTVAAGVRVPLLLTLTVVGRVRLNPADPLDQALGTAFDDHQRRLTQAGRLLGPDAVPYVSARLSELGASVRIEPSPWRLGSGSAALAATWLEGWLAAAVEQDPTLTGAAERYRARRHAQLDAGALEVTVGHSDLLVWWP